MADDIMPRVAVVTPSYAQDFERCRLLCDSIDHYVSDVTDHYILVDDDDYELFSKLGSERRHVVNEQDILPNWLFSFKAGLTRSARKLWVSNRTWPMRGWHIQQLRRIAIADYVSHEGLLYCDSDMLFVKPFHLSQLWTEDGFRFYRKDNGISEQLPNGGQLHMGWTNSAAKLLGLAEPSFPAPDYINNLVSWRRSDVVDMCRHIEQSAGRDWVSAIARNRSFSECQIFGAFVDGIKGGSGYWHTKDGLCQTYWAGKALDRQSVSNFVDTMTTGQVAIGIQSFTGTDPRNLRHLINY